MADFKVALTLDGDLYSRFFIETGPVSSFDPSTCNATMSGSYAIDLFNCYTVGDASALPSAGTGWSDLWTGSVNFVRFVSSDDFESYTAGAVSGSDINAGTGWSGSTDII